MNKLGNKLMHCLIRAPIPPVVRSFNHEAVINIETVNYCQEYFGFSLPSVLWAKRVSK